MKFKIKTNTKAEKYAAILLITKMTGVPINRNMPKTVDTMDMDYPYIQINNGDIGGTSNDEGDIFDYATQLPEIIAALINPPKDYIVKDVTKSYGAKITKDGIAVGCQNVSFEKFQELVD
jgi:hypothetical protein